MNTALKATQQRITDFFEKKKPLIYSIIFKAGGKPNDADDILQEAWLRTYRAADKYDPVKSPALTSWIYTIVRNITSDFVRKRRPFSLDELQENLNFEPKVDPIAAFDQKEDSQTTFKIIMNRLPIKHRSIIRDRLFNDKSYEDLASELNIKQSTVRGRFHVAMMALKEEASRYRARLLKWGVIVCKCGCGTQLSSKDDKGRIRTEAYARGHHRRHFAETRSQETRLCQCGCGKTIFKYDRWSRERFFKRGHENNDKRIYTAETRKDRLVQSKLTLRKVYKERALRAGVVAEKTVIKSCGKCQQSKPCKFTGHYNADCTPRYNNWCIQCMNEYARTKRQLYRDREKAKANCA